MNRESKAKHTTWKSKRISDDLFFVKDMDGNTVATVWDTKPNIDGSANARLIAEAPVMLEMLQRIVDLEPILAYPNDTHAEHQGEAQAVSTMLNDVKELIKKIEQ